jgi:hypothetical protein
MATALAQGCRAHHQAVAEHDGSGHEFGRFIASIPEHHALVAGPLLLVGLFVFVDACGDFGRLAVDGGQHSHRCGIQTMRCIDIPDVTDHITDEVVEVQNGTGTDFSSDKHHAGRRESLAGNPAVVVGCHAGIEDRIGNLIAQLVGMAFADRFGSEEEWCVGHVRAPFSELFYDAASWQ